MDITFNYIRNRISEYRKSDIIDFCHKILEENRGKVFPAWTIFTLMKWTYLYGEKKFPYKLIDRNKFAILCDITSKFNEEYLIQLIKENKVDRAFLVLFNQQLYLQKKVYGEIAATQLKLYSKLSGKYDIEKSFESITNLKTKDFLRISFIIWGYAIYGGKDSIPRFNGYLESDFWRAMESFIHIDKLKAYVKLLTLNPDKIENSIKNFKRSIKNEDLQNLEVTFFTMYPFQLYNNRLRLVHESIFSYVVNYFIYDYMKENDSHFTTEFGSRVEKFVKISFDEISLSYMTENEIRRTIGRESKVIDFYLPNEKIFIECKASELQAYPTVNPTDDLIYNSLKSSFIKAYFEQLNPVAEKLSPDDENWGIIITYKEFFYSQYTPLFEIGKDKYINFEKKFLPPENVFIIDLYTWNKIIYIVKEKKINLKEILLKARENNKQPETMKQFFEMHLDEYNMSKMDLSYLELEKNEILIN